MLRWIDTHCHLDAHEFGALAHTLRAEAASKGVAHCVLPAVEPGNFDAVRVLAHTQADSYCLGIHPLYVAQVSEQALTQLADALALHHDDPHLVAVGEMGLDYFVPELRRSPLLELQMHFFVEQLKLARLHDLPVVLHSRRAVDAVHQALRATMGRAWRWRGIAHAFNGSLQQAQGLIGLGLKLGFGGALTYPRALQLRRLATELPLSALVLETDAPDMPPHWLYVNAEQRAAGQVQPPNSPTELPRIGAELAALRGISVADLARATYQNGCEALPRLSRLPAAS